jgi:hypothetical protein
MKQAGDFGEQLDYMGLLSHIMSKLSPIRLDLSTPSTRVTDISYVAFWNMSSLLGCGNQSEMGQIMLKFFFEWQAGDGLPTMRQVVSSSKQKFTVFLSTLKWSFYSAL